MALAALLTLGPSPGQAIVGGAEDQGPLSRATVMVLSSLSGVCSGVVVAPDALLTAAHCVTGAPGPAGAAGAVEYRVHYRDENGRPVFLRPSAIAVHPGYDARAIKGRRPSIDLALLRLPEPLPARFGTAALSVASAPAGLALAAGGYGVTREGDARSMGVYRTARLAAVEPHGASRILVWAEGSGAADAATGVCEGDSGGPIAREGGSAVLAVTAWSSGAKGRQCGGYSQGILLGPQRAWIDANLRAWGANASWR